jgi:diadenosine tetraphosphatase ApaH/serine/threonine PP2A family protein phosphatase
MARYAIFSDIHGNREALDTFLEDSQQHRADRYLCCGDIVGYGADPAYCLEKVRALCRSEQKETPQITRGNHDDAVATLTLKEMNSHAREAALWSHRQLSETQLDFLENLPLSLEIEDKILLVHSSPAAPHRWHYILSLDEMQMAFRHFSLPVCCVGHTHVPFIAQVLEDDDPVMLHEEHIVLRPDARYLINVGSIGQPRDNDPRGCYLIYDTEENFVDRIRFDYDIAAAQKKIRQAGLPSILAERLSVGF